MWFQLLLTYIKIYIKKNIYIVYLFICIEYNKFRFWFPLPFQRGFHSSSHRFGWNSFFQTFIYWRLLRIESAHYNRSNFRDEESINHAPPPSHRRGFFDTLSGCPWHIHRHPIESNQSTAIIYHRAPFCLQIANDAINLLHDCNQFRGRRLGSSLSVVGARFRDTFQFTGAIISFAAIAVLLVRNSSAAAADISLTRAGGAFA